MYLRSSEQAVLTFILSSIVLLDRNQNSITDPVPPPHLLYTSLLGSALKMIVSHLSNLSMAFCTFLVKFVGKGSLLFSELCFLSPSESPLPITISPRLWLLSHRPGREPRALGSTVRWLPEPFPRGAEAAARPGIPGTSAPRPPSPEPRAPLALRPRGIRDPRARRDAASGAGGAHGRGGSRGSRHSFPLRTLRSSGGWVPQRGLPTLPSFLPPASAAMVASTLRPFPPSPARTSGKAGH